MSTVYGTEAHHAEGGDDGAGKIFALGQLLLDAVRKVVDDYFEPFNIEEHSPLLNLVPISVQFVRGGVPPLLSPAKGRRRRCLHKTSGGRCGGVRDRFSCRSGGDEMQHGLMFKKPHMHPVFFRGFFRGFAVFSPATCTCRPPPSSTISTASPVLCSMRSRLGLRHKEGNRPVLRLCRVSGMYLPCRHSPEEVVIMVIWVGRPYETWACRPYETWVSSACCLFLHAGVIFALTPAWLR